MAEKMNLLEDNIRQIFFRYLISGVGGMMVSHYIFWRIRCWWAEDWAAKDWPH